MSVSAKLLERERESVCVRESENGGGWWRTVWILRSKSGVKVKIMENMSI